MRRATYTSRVWDLAAARFSYVALSSTLSLAIFFASFFASLSFDVSSVLLLDFLLLLPSFSASRLRLFFLSEDFFTGSLSEAEVAGVLVPEGAAEASVGTAELSESPRVPAIDSPFTKNPYKPPRLIPFFWIWLRVLYLDVRLGQGESRGEVYLLTASDVLQTIVEGAHPPLVVSCVGRLLLSQTELILLMSYEERLLDTSALAIEGVACALPSLFAQILFCIHRFDFVCGVLMAERLVSPLTNFFVGCSWRSTWG